MNDALVSFWKRADLQDHAFRDDEIGTWPAMLREMLETTGILRRIQDARSVDCDACGETHFAEVVRDPTDLESPYYLCAKIGRVPLKPSHLKRWAISFDHLATFLNDRFSLAGSVIEVLAGRVWLLGRLGPHAGATEVFLFRGIWWPDTAHVLDHCVRLRQAARPVVLLVRRFPSELVWQNRETVLLALSELMHVDPSGLVISRDRVVEAASVIGTKALTALRVPRSMGSDAAVEALLALKGKKGWTMEELARHVGITARTLQGLTKRRVVRSSVFRTMAERLDITPEEFLAGNVPGAR